MARPSRTVRRWVPSVASSLTALLGIVAVVVAVGSSAAMAASCLRPPVEAPIARRFEAPACPYCSGHRGVSYATAAGVVVTAAAAGSVTFAGVVAGTRYVVIRHADGIVATYGGLGRATVGTGDPVAVGAVVGVTGGELYFGLRSGPDQYVDPEPFLGRLVVPPYLVPTDGSPGRPPPPARLECPAAGAGAGSSR